MSVYDFRMMGLSILLVGMVIFGLSRSVHSQAGGVAAGGQMVKGDVLNIEEDVYVVKEITGQETRLQVTKETRMEDRIKVGDKIEAQVASDGHVTSMKVHIPNAVPSTSSGPSQLP